MSCMDHVEMYPFSALGVKIDFWSIDAHYDMMVHLAIVDLDILSHFET